MKSIMESARYERSEVSFDVFDKALNTQSPGHEDSVDSLLYENSVVSGLRLLAMDRQLRSSIREHRLEDTAVFPSELKILA